MLAMHFSSKQIAGRLGVSERTVDNHLGRAYTKLAISNGGRLCALLQEDGPPQ